MKAKEERNKTNECYSCRFKRTMSGNAHIKCINPDQNMEGNVMGIKHGWFMYPHNFDPVWKTKDCNHYEEMDKQ